MPILATFLTTLFSAFLTLFARFFVMEKAAKLAFWSVVLAMGIGLYTALSSCVTGTCAVAISSLGAIHAGVGMGLRIAFNPVTLSAASCYITVWIVCSLYVIKKKAINIFTGAG